MAYKQIFVGDKAVVVDETTGEIKTLADVYNLVAARVPVLGQALAAVSMPVVLPAAQITTLTPPAAITGFATETKQDSQLARLSPISWANATITKIAGTGETALTAGCANDKKAYLLGLFGTIAAGGTLTIEDEDDNDLSGPMSFDPNGGIVAVGGGGFPVLWGPANKDLQVNSSQVFNGWAIVVIA